MKRKLLLLCCLSVIGLSSSKLTKYEKGKGYHYDYAGYILSGVPDHSNSKTGFFVYTHVHLHYIKDRGNNRIFSMHFIKPRVNKIAGDVSPVFPERLDSPFKLQKQKMHKRYHGLSKEVLELPIEFTWSKMGHVKSMRKSPKEKQDSLNIKRAVLSMLCGNFGAIPVGHGAGLTVGKGTTMAGVEGKCQNTNTFQRIRNSLFEFNKVRSFLKCRKMPSIAISNLPKAFAARCVPDSQSRVNADSHTKVLLQRKTRDTFFIEKAVVYSRYGARGPSRKREDLAAQAVQELKFVGVAYAHGKSRKSTRGYRTVSIIMDLPSKAAPKSTKTFTNEVNDILKTMRANKMKAEYLKQQFLLVQLLRKASVKQLERILRSKGTRFTIMKLLSTVGTQASIKVLAKALRDRKVPQEVTALLVMVSATTASNPEALAYEFRNMLKDNVFAAHRHKKTYKAIILGTGTLIGAIRTVNRKYLVSKVRKWFHKVMKSDISKIMSKKEKAVVLLKSLGNTGFHELSSILIPYLKGGQSLSVRLAAMRAWRKFILKLPRVTAYIMFQLFANRNEDTEIRINAFMMMMRAGPHSPSRLGYFSHLVMRDSDTNLRNFVMSALVTLSKVATKSVCFVGMKVTSRKLLRRLPRNFQEIDKTKSMMFIYPVRTLYWLDIFGYVIYTKESILPRTVYISDAMVGENSVAKTFEIQMRSLDNQENIRKFAVQLGILRDVLRKPRSSNFRGKRSTAEKKGGTMAVELGIFDEDIMAEEDATGSMINRMLKKLDISTGYVLQDHYVQPTSFGLPLTLDLSMGFVGKMKFKPEKRLSSNRKFSVEASTTWSEAYMLEGTLGTSMGNTHSKVVLDIRADINPGGKTSLKSKTEYIKGSLKSQMSILPSGKAHKLMDLNLNTYLLLGNEKSSKLQRIDMTSLRHVPIYNKVYKSGFGGLPHLKIRKTSSNKRSSIPSFLEVSILKGPVFGIGFEVKSEDLSATESDNYDKEAIESQTEILKAVNSTMKSDANAYLLPYTVGSNLFKKDVNKKLAIKFHFLVHQRKGRSKKKTVLNADVSFKSKRGDSINFDMKISDRVKKPVLSATGKVKNIGPDVYFNPNNPFQVTTNKKRVRQLTITRGSRTLLALNATSEMSDRWVESWKSLLKSAKSISREYPQIHQCILDGQQNSDYSYSPNCIETWETLQVFDTHKISLSYAPLLRAPLKNLHDKVSKKLKRYFTDVTFTTGVRDTKIKMRILPMDTKGLRHLKGFRTLRRVLQRSATCNVGIYKSKPRLLVNSFDGNRYNTLVNSKLFNDRSLIIAQTRSRGGFTVAFSYGKSPSTLVYYVLNRKACTVKVMMKNGETETDTEGSGCVDKKNRDTNIIDVGSSLVKDAINVTIPGLKLTVVTRPSRFASVTVGKSYYFNSLRGICGNFDGLALEGEFLGKSCKRPEFTDLEKFTSDYVTKNPTKVKKCR